MECVLTDVERGANMKTASRLYRERCTTNRRKKSVVLDPNPERGFFFMCWNKKIIHLSDFPEDGTDSA